MKRLLLTGCSALSILTSITITNSATATEFNKTHNYNNYTEKGYYSHLSQTPLNSLNPYSFDYNTNVTYPELEEGQIFKPVFTYSHKLLFYTGKQNNKYISGYFTSQHFLGWLNYQFPPHDAYRDYLGKKYIISASNGPKNSVVVLSHVDGIGQLFSTSYDHGKLWHTVELRNKNNLFDKLVYTDSNGLKRIMAYGENQTLFYSSTDAFNWQQWAFPNTCLAEEHCVYNNKFFDAAYDKYIFLQSRTAHEIETNKLYVTTNLQDWYLKSVPFIHDKVEKVFKSKYDVLAASVKEKDNSHKLWLTPDLNNWVNFDLPSEASVADLKVHNENNILLLLTYKTTEQSDSIKTNCLIKHDGEDGKNSDHGDNDCPCEPKDPENPTETVKVVTELVSLDPETKALELLDKFDGEVTSITAFDNKTYLSGNFYNYHDNKPAALVSLSGLY